MDNKNDTLLSIAGTVISPKSVESDLLENGAPLDEIVKKSDETFATIMDKMARMKKSPDLFAFSLEVEALQQSLSKAPPFKRIDVDAAAVDGDNDKDSARLR